jgi:septal ring factor EnvC (AmiA/AmiB activator)
MRIYSITLLVVSVLALILQPCIAADSLRLLAQVAHQQAEDAAKDLEKLAEKQQSPKISAFRNRLSALNKSLSEVKMTEPGAEKRLREIDGELKSLRKEIQDLTSKGQVKVPQKMTPQI